MSLAAAIILFLVLAGVALASADDRGPRVYAITKFAASLSLLIVAGTTHRDGFGHGVMMALLASALGDAALVRKRDARFFLAGAGLFLVAHVAYSVAFISTAGSGSALAIVIGAAAAGVLTITLLRRVSSGVPAYLRTAVKAYAAAITVMFAAACGAAAGNLQFLSRVAVLVGATFFVAGDSVFSVNQFGRPIPQGQTLSMSLYWTGQFAIALAARSPSANDLWS